MIELQDPRHEEFYPLCQNCRYPLLSLRGFDGISSADNTDLLPDRMGSIFQLNPWRLAVKLRRRRWVRRMRRALLADYPYTLVCPICFLIIRRGLHDDPEAPPVLIRPFDRLQRR